MYQANLSYKVLQKYLSEVSEASLIDFVDETRSYMLTGKGKQFLETYKDYSKNSKTIERRLNEVNCKKKILDELCPDQ